MQPILEMRGITKTFGSTRALRGVDFTVERGEVHALLGRNGAGKSTLVSALSGFTPADAGDIRIGKTAFSADGQGYAARIRNDIAHVQQTPRLFSLLTVAENLFIESPDVRNRFGMVSHRRMQARAAGLLSDWNVDIAPGSLAGQLDAGTRQLLEIIKALSRGVPVMILDEPTAGLDPLASEILKEKIIREKAKHKLILITSHILSDLDDLTTHVMHLQEGKLMFLKDIGTLQEETGEIKLGKAIAKIMKGEIPDGSWVNTIFQVGQKEEKN